MTATVLTTSILSLKLSRQARQKKLIKGDNMIRTCLLAFTLLFISSINSIASNGPAEELLRQEATKLLDQNLWGDYDIEKIVVSSVEEVSIHNRDYPLFKAVISFSTKRNENRSKNMTWDGRTTLLNQNLYDDSDLCSRVNHLFLHCGVETGHIFEGDLELLLVQTGDNWQVLNPNWRRKTTYPLEGYLLMDGKNKEDYVLFSE